MPPRARPARVRRDPNGPTWRALALASLALVVACLAVVATLAVVPTRPVQRVGVARGFLLWEGWLLEWFWPTRDNVSLPAGSNATQVVVDFATVGGYRMNLTFGLLCLQGCLPVGPPTPPIYVGTNLTSGEFGWECDHPWECDAPGLGVITSATMNESWTLSWEVVYNYTATEPLL